MVKYLVRSKIQTEEGKKQELGRGSHATFPLSRRLFRSLSSLRDSVFFNSFFARATYSRALNLLSVLFRLKL